MPQRKRSIFHSCPWWLWAEHLLLMGFVGRKAVGLWRGLLQARRHHSVAVVRGDSHQHVAQTSQHDTSVQQKTLCGAAATPSEHGALTSLVPGAPDAKMEDLSRAALSLLSRLKLLGGPSDVLAWPDVAPAPGASMDMTMVSEGQASSFRDSRGVIYKFKLAENVYVNMYYTKGGFRRSGDLHDCNQYDVILHGRTRLRMIDPHTGREVVQEFGANDFIVIPARTPHMFEFLEDNYLLEWWEDTFRAWYYKPYRTVLEANLPLVDTAQRDFSVPLNGTVRQVDPRDPADDARRREEGFLEDVKTGSKVT